MAGREDKKDSITIQVLRLPHGKGLGLPSYMTDSSSGMDIQAAVSAPVPLAPFARALIPTGFALAIPDGYEAQIRPRSGLAVRYGITLLNTPGTIDADYRGEVKICLVNLGQEPFTVERGQRIAQMVIAKVERAELVEVDELPKTRRGKGGFGHTGR